MYCLGWVRLPDSFELWDFVVEFGGMTPIPFKDHCDPVEQLL